MRSRCGRIVYFGSRAEAIPASNTPNRVSAEPACPGRRPRTPPIPRTGTASRGGLRARRAPPYRIPAPRCRWARAGGFKVLAAGDQELLAAVEGGGGMSLLASELGYVQLAEAVRFKAVWEQQASLGLRDGQLSASPACSRCRRVPARKVPAATPTLVRAPTARCPADRRAVSPRRRTAALQGSVTCAEPGSCLERRADARSGRGVPQAG